MINADEFKLRIKNNNYTEKEKKILFKKIERIAKLFGLKITIEENKNMSDKNCYAIVGENKIQIVFREEDRTKLLDKLFFKNINRFHSLEHKKIYKECPAIIKFSLHEISHLATMDFYDVERYSIDYNHMMYGAEFSCQEEREITYRNLPYEKLADNLSSELYYNNYDIIIKILLGKRVRITKKRIKNNLRMAEEMKSKYII